MCAICEFKIEFDISHPQALTVAVATRQAIEAGTLPERTFEGPLGNVRLRAAAIDTLQNMQSRIEEALTTSELMALPDFYVLLIENATWGFFRATEKGFDPEIVPDMPNVTSENLDERDIVVVAAEASMHFLLNEGMSFSQAVAENLVVLDANRSDRNRLLDALEWGFARPSVPGQERTMATRA